MDDAAKTALGLFGIGGVGHMAVQFAKVEQCKAIAFSRSQKHLDVAKKLGAEAPFIRPPNLSEDYIDVFDMEAYALAKVCSYYHVPFISFKYITDNANEHSPKDWEENLGDGIVEFEEKVLKELKWKK